MKRIKLCPHCGKPVKQYLTGQAKTCGSPECLRKSHYRNKAPGLGRMRAGSKEDECPFCGDPLKQNKEGEPGRRWKTCGDDVCVRAYQRYYRRDRRAK